MDGKVPNLPDFLNNSKLNFFFTFSSIGFSNKYGEIM